MNTCNLKHCNQTSDDTGYRTENGLRLNGYSFDGHWFCSPAHMQKGKYIDLLMTLLYGVFSTAAVLSIFFILYPLLDKHFFEVPDNAHAFYAALIICPLSFLACHMLSKNDK